MLPVHRAWRRCARAVVAAAIVAASVLSLASCEGTKPVMMLVPEKDFYDPEYTIPRRALEGAGYTVVVVTPSGREALGLEGLKVVPDSSLAGLTSSMFSGLFFVGGTGGVSFMGDAEVHRIVREFDVEGKPIGAQCITPAVVAEAGLLTGLSVTCWPKFTELLEANGAKFSGRVVDQQGNILTAMAGRADYIQRFVDEYLELLQNGAYVIPELRAAKEAKPDSFAVNGTRPVSRRR